MTASPPDAPTGAETKKRPRSRQRKLVLGATIVFVIVIALYVPRMFDGEPFDGSALQPPPIPIVGPADNMIPAFADLDELLIEPVGWIGIDFGPDAVDPVDWDALQVALEKNEPYFQALEELLARPRCLADPPEDFESAADPSLMSLRRAADWIDARRGWLCHRGEVGRAAEFVAAWNSAMVKFMEQPTSLLHFLIGIALVGNAHMQIAEISSSPDVSKDDLAMLARALETDPVIPGKLVLALRHEYRAASNTVRKMAARASRLTRWFAFKENRTLRELGLHVQAVISAIEERDRTAFDAMSVTPASPWRVALTGNPVGETLVALMHPVHAGLYDRLENAIVRRAVVRVVVALRRYELDHGELPEELGALVPEYVADGTLKPEGHPVLYRRSMRWVGLREPEELTPAPAPRIDYQAVANPPR